MDRAILFDFNGVIVDDEPQHCDALIATLAEYGLPLNRDDYYRDYLGFDDREVSGRLRGSQLRADDGVLDHAIERKATQDEKAIRQSMTLVPGSTDFIQDASRKGYRLGVVSGALRREIELVLSLAGLRGLFGVVIASEDVNACKPDPQGYERARETLIFAATMRDHRGLPSGLGAARRAGIRCAMVATSIRLRISAHPVWQDLRDHTVTSALVRMSAPRVPDRARLDRLRQGAVVVRTEPAAFNVTGMGALSVSRDCSPTISSNRVITVSCMARC
jgi:beta-phosphoglucomutase-like phosphatase (HAD superfamily)